MGLFKSLNSFPLQTILFATWCRSEDCATCEEVTWYGLAAPEQSFQLCHSSPSLKGFPSGSGSKESAWSAGDPGSIPGSGRPLKKEMATHSSTLAWMKEPGGLQSMGLQRVRHDLVTSISVHFQGALSLRIGSSCSYMRSKQFLSFCIFSILFHYCSQQGYLRYSGISGYRLKMTLFYNSLMSDAAIARYISFLYMALNVCFYFRICSTYPICLQMQQY